MGVPVAPVTSARRRRQSRRVAGIVSEPAPSSPVALVHSAPTDRRAVRLHVEQRRIGPRLVWYGQLLVGDRRVREIDERSRSRLLADLIDAMLANGVSIDPCCIDAPTTEGAV